MHIIHLTPAQVNFFAVKLHFSGKNSKKQHPISASDY